MKSISPARVCDNFRRKFLLIFTTFLCLFFAEYAQTQVSLTATVGTPTGSFTTLKGAFDAINAGTHKGVIAITITANTTETATAVLNASGGTVSYTAVSIQPSGGAWTITGAIAAGSALISLNGADNVTIDGLNSGGNALTIQNTTASATSGTTTILLIAGATSNTITNTTILGSFSGSATTNGGNIFLSTDAMTANGNDNNTFSFNNIGPAGSNLSTKGIYMNGSTSTTAIGNSGNIITGNNIFDYFGAGVTSAGVYIGGGTTDNNILNNKFYQTASRAQTTSGQHSAIWINNTSGNNFVVTGNTIGYASSTATGTYTITGSPLVVPIFVSVSTTTASDVSGNTITSMAVSGNSSGALSSGPFRIIHVGGGVVTSNNNVIGSQSATGAITYTSSSTSTSDIYGLYNYGSSSWTSNGNTIGGITVTNSSSGVVNFHGMCAYTSASVTWTCQNNTVGGTVANSINVSATSISNIASGIFNNYPAGTITGNTIRNITTSAGTGAGISSGISGILLSNTAVNVVGSNTIYNIKSTLAGAATVNGILHSGSATNNIIEKNLIYDLDAPNAAGFIHGINIVAGTSTYRNNMIRLGVSGSSATVGLVVNGINETAGTNSIRFNSVYLGGAPISGTANSFAFQSTVTSNTRSYQNNIFYNARSNNGSTGKHYAIRVGGTVVNPAGLTTNYNILLAPGTGGNIGLFNSVDRATLAAWNTATGQDANSQSADPSFVAATASTPDLHILTSVVSPADAAGTAIAAVTDDFDGSARSGLTPVDIGADAFIGLSAPAPTITSFTPAVVCVTGGQTVTITGTNFVSVSAVTFNGVNAASYNVVNATTITAVTPASVTAGNIAVTNTGGTATSSTAYTVEALPTIAISPASALVCVGTGTPLTASGASTYAWSPATGLSAVTGANVTATPTTTTTYTITGTTAAGCVNTTTVKITVSPTPTAMSIVQNPTSICEGGIANLVASGGAVPVSQYPFSTSSTTYTAITGTAVAGAVGDDVGTGNLPIGFTFNYNGIAQTVFGVSSNGLLLLGNTSASITTFATNALASNANVLSPFWDDNNTTGGTVIYATTGVAPNRVLTVQWTNMHIAGSGSSTNPTMSVQALLYENGTVQFIYGPRSAALSTPTATIGISGNSGTYQSVTPQLPIENSTVSTGTENVSVTEVNIPVGTVYTFTAPVIAWSPMTDLYTNAGATTAYIGAYALSVYSKPTTARTYTVSSSLGTCSSSATITVTPVANPTVVVASTAICKGTGTTLTASGATTYTWSPATGLSATTGSSVTANPAATTTYTITGMNGTCSGSTTATVTVNDPVAIVSQSGNQVIVENTDATYSVTATGTGISYQWQVNTGSGFANIPGANSASYTVVSATAAMSGYQYQCIVSGTAPCPPVTSTPVSLTISTISITAQPANQTICSNDNAVFTISTSGSVSNFQWQVNSGSGWSNISGETSATLTLSGMAAANTGNQYRCVLNSGSITSDPATLTVYDRVIITTHPANQVICSNAASVTFSTVATGSNLTYQWQVSTNGGGAWSPVGGATLASYTINSPALSLNGNQYRVVVSGQALCASVTSNPATLTVNQIVAITTQPASAGFCVGSPVSFNIVATGTGLTYQWVANNGSDIVLVNGADFSGVQTATLNVLNPGSYGGYNFKCVVSGTAPCAALTSNNAALTILPLFGGTYTVGAGGNYTTLTAAVAAYNAATCFTGPVVFDLIDATYSAAETFPITVNENLAAGTYTLTIKPAAGNTATITGSSAVAILRLNAADYVIIDGSNNGTTSRNLTIANTSTGTSSAVIWINSTASPVDAAVNNIVKNNIVKGNSATTTYVGIAATGSTIGGVAEAQNGNNLYQNNLITASYYGMALVGPTGNESGNSIIGNTIGSSVAASKIGFQGILVNQQLGMNVTGNTVLGIALSANANAAGIYVGGSISGGIISKNNISDIKNSITAGRQAAGIWLNSSSTNTGLTISNNMIYDVANSGGSATLSRGAHGIAAYTGGGYNIYYNSVVLTTDPGGATGVNAAFYVASVVTGLNVQNNIFSNSQTIGNRYAIYSDAANTAFTAINYNDYFSKGTLGYIGSARATLANIVTGFGGNANSKNVEPVFIGLTDLHLNTTTNLQLDGTATPIGSITTDYDNETRNVSTPDMGADEFIVQQCTAPVAGTAVSSGNNLCVSGTVTLSLSGATITGLGNTYQWQSSTDGVGYADISGAQAETYAATITSTTYFKCIVTCVNGPASSTSTAVMVTVTNSSVVSTTPAARCGTGTLTLQATGSAGTTLNWYAAASGGTSLQAGTSYTTPSISTTTNYWVDASIGSNATAGRPAPAATTSDFWPNYGLVFSLSNSIILNSVVVYPSNTSPAAMTIRLVDNTGTQVAGTSDVIFTPVSASGSTPQTVNLGYNIPAGNNYRLLIVTGMNSNNKLVQETTGYTYPITNGSVSITSNWNNGSTSSTYYDWFYNWSVTEFCRSPRTQVIATVNAAPAITFSSTSVSNCAGQTSATLVSLTSPASDYNTYTWTPAGTVTGSAAAGWNFNPAATTTYTLNASQSGGSLCVNSKTVAVTVNPTPTVTASANLTNVCPGTSVNLTGSGTELGTTFSYTEGFESGMPAGWVVLQAGSGSVWTVTTILGGPAHTGSRAAEYVYDEFYAANTWMITNGQLLNAGTTYTVSFWELTGSFNERLKLTVGTAQTVAGQSTTLLDLTAHQVTTYTLRTATFTPSTTGTYYFGLQAYSAADKNFIDIDDFSITGTTMTPNTYSWTSSPAGFTAATNNASTTVNVPTTYTLAATNSLGCTGTNTASVAINTATPSSVQSAVGMTLNTGDYLWSGYTTTEWTTASNWYQYNGTAFTNTASVPVNTNRVFILPSSTSGVCVSSANNTVVSAAGVANSLYIGTGATMVINAGQNLDVYGDWTNNGTFNPDASGAVSLRGTNAQSIGGSSANNFTNLVLNKSAGIVTLGKPVAVTGTLTMTAGTFNTTAANLLTVGASAAAPGTLLWTAGTVVGPLKRFYATTADDSQAAGIFPVGNATYNRYARVNFTGNPGGGFITAEYKAGVCPIGYNGLVATINGQFINNYENEGYWEITPTGGNLNTTNYDLVLRGNHLSTVNDLNRVRIIKSSNHAAWNDNPAGDGDHVPAASATTDFTIGATSMMGFSWFNVGSDNANPLPVELTHFSADCNNAKGVIVKWSTASEQNSQKFILERSRDMNIWGVISEVPAAGNSNFHINYSKMDIDPVNGIAYYRLVQVDNNGAQKIYGPISIACGNGSNSMSVFPNPSKGDFKVEISSVESISGASLQIADLTGKIISERSINVVEGTNQVLFDGMDLEYGTYIIKLVTGNDNPFKPVRVVIN